MLVETVERVAEKSQIVRNAFADLREAVEVGVLSTIGATALATSGGTTCSAFGFMTYALAHQNAVPALPSG